MIEPLDIKCTICNAKPQELCATITSPIKTRETPHYARIDAARHLSLQQEAKDETRVDGP